MHPFDLPRDYIFLIGGPAFVILLLITPFVYTRIVKPLDKLFYGKGLTLEEGVWYASTAMRMSQYTLCIVFPQRSKKDRYAKLVYDGYDFRGNATKTQINLSYCYLFCVFMLALATLLLVLYDFVYTPLLG